MLVYKHKDIYIWYLHLEARKGVISFVTSSGKKNKMRTRNPFSQVVGCLWSSVVPISLIVVTCTSAPFWILQTILQSYLIHDLLHLQFQQQNTELASNSCLPPVLISLSSQVYHFLPCSLTCPNWLPYVMARHLDPKLQRIIENANRNVQTSDTLHPSVIPDDFTHTPLDRHLSRCQPREELSFLATGFQTAHLALDDFGTYYPSLKVCHFADVSDFV
jgi:hypothetical protein